MTEECLTDVDKEKVASQITETEDAKEPEVKKPKLDDKKEKLRGQNKARPPPYKAPREANLCPWIVDQAVGEPDKKCNNPRCQFMHDRVEYLKLKDKDIAERCFFFDTIGRCPRGAACRMGATHLTDTGLNIVDEARFEEHKKKPLATKNQLPKELQNTLRKRKYNFGKSEKIIKANDEIKRQRIEAKNDKSVTKTPQNDEVAEKNGTGDKPVDKEEPKIGPVSDYDIVKELPSEKKKIDWNNKILLSPLTTVGNLPFRRICKEYGADFTCGEMALAPKILKGATEEWALVKRHESEDVFGVQICGNNPRILTRCAQLLESEVEVDFIDLNLGCPIDLIYRQGGGSGMLNKLNVLEISIKSISQVCRIPLTIKTRMGVYQDKPVAHNLTPMFRDWGASMITVRKQRWGTQFSYISLCPIRVNDEIKFDKCHRCMEGRESSVTQRWRTGSTLRDVPKRRNQFQSMETGIYSRMWITKMLEKTVRLYRV